MKIEKRDFKDSISSSSCSSVGVKWAVLFEKNVGIQWTNVWVFQRGPCEILYPSDTKKSMVWPPS